MYRKNLTSFKKSLSFIIWIDDDGEGFMQFVCKMNDLFVTNSGDNDIGSLSLEIFFIAAIFSHKNY